VQVRNRKEYAKIARLKRLLAEEEVAMKVNEYAPMKGGPCGNWVDALRLFLKGQLHR
jgi:hypothetical protein